MAAWVFGLAPLGPDTSNLPPKLSWSSGVTSLGWPPFDFGAALVALPAGCPCPVNFFDPDCWAAGLAAYAAPLAG